MPGDRNKGNSFKYEVKIATLPQDSVDRVGLPLDLIAVCCRMNGDNVSNCIAIVNSQFLK
ncbi:MAG: hypothetical protein CVU33_02290 [Betaproteobacteria bacterium HGW-Betaproteobacteria-6]|nr:MAG: hypothetical protein CVU33_02290 [Betaproteobacteria bacterium HGW-Betaproteobacteria-6]